ncbi:MAG: hypothetical protein ABSD63_07340 [Candidatus Korobacteraceae bacterium]|jgi:hypothetical protein
MTRKIFHLSTIVVGMLALFFSVALTAQDNSLKPTVNHAVASGVSAPLRDLAKLPTAPHYGFHEANPVHRLPRRPAASVVDRVEQKTAGGSANYSIGVNFLGIGNGFPGYTIGFAPPDTNMAVGDTQIVEWVNTDWTIFDKSGNLQIAGTIAGNALWASGIPGTLCANYDSGDPIAQWDKVAHRWLLFQNVFVSPYAVCVAVSTSADATGNYYVYQFSVPGNGFPDYPKIGVWPTGYFQAHNNYGVNEGGWVGPQVCAYNSAKLLLGDSTAEQQCFQLTSGEDSLLPGDLDSPTPPPAGQDEFYIGSVGDVDNTHLSVYSFHADFANPANSHVTGSGNSQLVSIASFTPACYSQLGTWGGDCVPQQGISDLLDSLGDRLMYRFAYYNDTSTFPNPRQHWYVNFDVAVSGGQIGVRWMEFATPQTVVGPTALTIAQQGTYAPDTNWRWMGSVARDQNNDVLLGYSESSASMYPSIFLAGRTPADTLGTLENEIPVVAGTGSQPHTANRWGDYSAMQIDPVDDCTFWYTTEYYMVTQVFDWSTQIASAKFAGCPPLSIAEQFVPLSQPCRAVDTRPPNGGGPIQGGTHQEFPISGEGSCATLPNAAAYSMNVTVVPGPTLGYLTIWPAGQVQPTVSTLNSQDGRIKANAAIVPAGTNGQISVFVTDTTNVIVDVNGYFAPVSGSTLAFYPLPPCRVADTRYSSYPEGLGPPSLTGGQQRDFPILNATATCNIPPIGVAAYSLNLTVVPHGSLGYLTVWPTGQIRPTVSTLNDVLGKVIANAAIVVAGTNGNVSVYPTSNTDLIIDINGYFAAPPPDRLAAPVGLSLYSVTPCRVIDTRHVGSGQPFTGTLSPPVDVLNSECGVSSLAQAYAFNATVVPVAGLGYLTLWPDGIDQPLVSTLNAQDGLITNNMAIVPAGTLGKVDAYASGLTQLILDISSYFAP